MAEHSTSSHIPRILNEVLEWMQTLDLKKVRWKNLTQKHPI